MKYRKLGNTGFEVSEVGIGGEYLEYEEEKTVIETMHEAMDLGVNILDIFMSEPKVRTNLGKAIKGRRDQIYIQGQICSVYENGQYGRTRDLEKSKRHLDDLFKRLDTDYIDIGMLHYIDNLKEWEDTKKNGILDYMLELKERGRFRTLGVSSHDAAVSKELVKSGYFQVLMFSINPAFDLVLNHVDMADYMGSPDMQLPSKIDIDPDRSELYNLCEEKGVGITVMKSLGAGRLLRAESSPFRVPMTVPQCIHYALSRPAVASVLIGAKSPTEIREAAAYCKATEQEKDYTGIYKYMNNKSEGECMYCNHCLPCPKNINVAAVTKILDAKRQGTEGEWFKEYNTLEHKASECIACGTCEKRCPFGVPVIANMKQAAEIFEK